MRENKRVFAGHRGDSQARLEVPIATASCKTSASTEQEKAKQRVRAGFSKGIRASVPKKGAGGRVPRRNHGTLLLAQKHSNASEKRSQHSRTFFFRVCRKDCTSSGHTQCAWDLSIRTFPLSCKPESRIKATGAQAPSSVRVCACNRDCMAKTLQKCKAMRQSGKGLFLTALQ